MCGITGFVGGHWPGAAEARSTLQRMALSIRHRGPDRSEIWLDENSCVGFAHNRLSILDLSAAGDQPMHSHSGRYVIIFNGEIYNHPQIRVELAAAGSACNWVGHSDTETLLAAIEQWGIGGALTRATGMFAFALWDKAERTLTLARDRLGEKPLYFGRQDHSGAPFLFASELKAIIRHPDFRPEIDRDALTQLLRYNCIPAPHSIYRGIGKLRPGTLLTLRWPFAESQITTYWSAMTVAEAGFTDPVDLADGEATDRLEQLLESAIAGQMIADVPLGAFLSGGIDSSTVVALMQKLSRRPVKTFTIGFNEQGYNEADHAKAVARHLGTDHTELYVTPAEARAIIPRLPDIFDEPFADDSQIPTHLVSALARSQVTVALSGDGGDEIFGGYERYRLTAALWHRVERVPRRVRAVAARALTALAPGAWTKLGNAAGGMLPKWAHVDLLGDKVHKGAPLLESRDSVELYDAMVSLWRDPISVVVGAGAEAPSWTSDDPALRSLGTVERMMALDMVGYLPDCILTKVDRAAMAVSLETRVPYLDHRVVEFAWRLPLHQKMRGRESKWILRRVLDRHVPLALIDRPKKGFALPLASWLRGPLRDWAEALLDPHRLRAEGYFRPEPILRVWQEHLAGRADHQSRLWSVLMFQAWLEVAPAAGAGLAPGGAWRRSA